MKHFSDQMGEDRERIRMRDNAFDKNYYHKQSYAADLCQPKRFGRNTA